MSPILAMFYALSFIYFLGAITLTGYMLKTLHVFIDFLKERIDYPSSDSDNYLHEYFNKIVEEKGEERATVIFYRLIFAFIVVSASIWPYIYYEYFLKERDF